MSELKMVVWTSQEAMDKSLNPPDPQQYLSDIDLMLDPDKEVTVYTFTMQPDHTSYLKDILNDIKKSGVDYVVRVLDKNDFDPWLVCIEERGTNSMDTAKPFRSKSESISDRDAWERNDN